MHQGMVDRDSGLPRQRIDCVRALPSCSRPGLLLGRDVD